MQPGLHRCRRHAQEIGGLLDAQALYIPHHENHPEDLRQVVNGPLDEVADLALRGSSLGVGGYGHQRKWNDLGFARGLRIKHLQVDHVPLSSQASKRLVEAG